MGSVSATHTSPTDTAVYTNGFATYSIKRAHRTEPKWHMADPIHRVPANGGGGGGIREHTVKHAMEESKALRAVSHEGGQVPAHVAARGTLEKQKRMVRGTYRGTLDCISCARSSSYSLPERSGGKLQPNNTIFAASTASHHEPSSTSIRSSLESNLLTNTPLSAGENWVMPTVTTPSRLLMMS